MLFRFVQPNTATQKCQIKNLVPSEPAWQNNTGQRISLVELADECLDRAPVLRSVIQKTRNSHFRYRHNHRKTLMKKFVFVFLAAFLLCVAASAQKIAKPTLTPKAATDAQKQLINQGIALHDAKKFDEAIAKYEQVLAENPDCTLAIYELGLTLYTKGDRIKAMETAHRGAKYKAEELPLFYGIMANLIDDVGKPEEALKIYRDAINMIGDDKDLAHHLSSLYYNVGVTYSRMNKYNEARTELKKAVEYNPRYASPHYLLAVVYKGSKYKIPAILAASRLLSLDLNSQRTKQSAAIIYEGLKPAKKNAQTGAITIDMDFLAPKDEGDFGMYEIILPTLSAVGKEKDGKKKTESEAFVDAFDTLASLLSEDKKLKSTFVGKNYVPFLADMKKQGHTKTFAYLILFLNGQPDGQKWLSENETKLEQFVNWAKAY